MLDDPPPEPAEGAVAYTPPKQTPMRDDASFLRTIWTTISNPYAAVPNSAYRSPTTLRRNGSQVSLYLCDPELIEEVLVKRPQDFPKSEIDHRVFRPGLGRGLLSAEGEDWRWKRRLAAPAFSPAALAGHAPAMARPFEAWARSAAARGGGDAIDVDEAMVAATLEVIDGVLFGRRSGLDHAVIADGISALLSPMNWIVVYALLNLPERTPFPGKGRQRRAAAAMRAEIARIVAARRRDAEDQVGEGLTGALLAARDPESGRPLSDDDMVDMLLTLVAAGHETSAHTLSWTLYCLAHQPDLQDKLAEEAQATMQEAGGDGLTAAALPRLSLIEAAVKETLRLYPVAPMMGRVTAGVTRLGAFDLPEGAFCIIPIYALHRNLAHWERPDEFDIARFHGKADPPRTLYMPFGAGPRVCIGARLAMMEMTLGLAALLRELRFAPSEDTAFDPVHALTLRPRNGLYLRVSARG